LAKDGTIILDLDKAAKTNHGTFRCEHCDLAPSLKEELVTIQFGSLEQVVLPLIVPTTLVEAKKLMRNIPNEDDEGWTLVTEWRPKKQQHVQPPPLLQRKRQSKKKNP